MVTNRHSLMYTKRRKSRHLKRVPAVIILKHFHITGRERQTDEEKHRKIRGARVRHYASEDFLAREETVPDASAHRRRWSVSYSFIYIT